MATTTIIVDAQPSQISAHTHPKSKNILFHRRRPSAPVTEKAG